MPRTWGKDSQLRIAAPMAVLVSMGCATRQLPGTPMSSVCQELPTVEECLSAAQSITDVCLKTCVEAQCAGVEVKCDATVREQCEKDRKAGVFTLGYTYMTLSMTVQKRCKNPVKEINWCQWDVSRDCRAKGMVHELAHSCGWDHGQGLGVPGEDGSLTCG